MNYGIYTFNICLKYLNRFICFGFCVFFFIFTFITSYDVYSQNDRTRLQRPLTLSLLKLEPQERCVMALGVVSACAAAWIHRALLQHAWPMSPLKAY